MRRLAFQVNHTDAIDKAEPGNWVFLHFPDDVTLSQQRALYSSRLIQRS